MAPKPKKGLKGSIDDVLGDLLGDDTTLPEKPVDPASHARDKAGAPQWLLSKAKAKSLLKSNAEGLAGSDVEVSGVSDADPMVFLESMKDLDDMDADLFGRVKSHSSSGKGAAKISGKEVPSHPKPVSTLTANEKGDTIPTKKPASSFSSCGLQYQFSFEDFKDPLTGLLSDEEEETPKKPPVVEGKPASNKSPNTTEGQGPSVPLTPGDTPIRKKELFDEGDDIMATLGFEDSPNAERRKMGDQEGPLPARFKLDELLGRGTATKLLTRPATGEHRELKLDQEYQKLEDKEDSWGDEILTFGAYQPTVASSEGRQSRRQSVRFLEGASDSKGDPNFKQSPPVASSPVHPKKGGADWLGLKDDDLDLLPPSPIQEAQQEGSAISIPSLPVLASQHSALTVLPSAAEPPTKGARLPAKASQASALRESEEEGEDWLSHILSQKKSPGLAREERARPYKGPNSVGTLGHPSSGSQPVVSTQVLEQATAGEASRSTTQGIPAARPDVTGSSMSWSQATVVLPVGDPKKGMASASGDLCSTEPVISVPHSQEPTRPSLPVQVGKVDKQSLLSESLMQSLLPGSAYQKQLLAAQGQLQSSTAQLQAELLQSQTKLSELEAQVRKLEMERAQHRMLLESLQQRHQADLELIEDAHRSRIKVLETSYQQREEQLRRENEALSAKHVLHCREAEQAQAELIAQHQRHLAAAAQEKDQEVARLRELQQASILEMRKDHEHQLQRLKMLKDQEIDAVTSATSHTRSLNGIIEQMEKFSSSLTALSSRVEASHLTTSQERELGIRQQDEQLRVLQERLGRQQRDMEEERGRLQEVIGKMEVRLNEQSRLLEQERWRVTAEKSKAESAQRTLEEQRKVMVQQISMEREELERAKSALLEEQKSVMHKCGEERRRLAAEWAEYFTQQKLSKERAEREAERALHVDSQREGTLISLTKEQAELTVRACELRAKEEKLAAEREAVERERQELRLEKDRLHKASLRLQARAQEVEHMSKVASKKYQEGEQALQEARQMQCEQQERLQAVQRQQEWLRQQEQHVHQEHLSLAQQRLQLNRVRQDLPSSLLGLPSRVQGPAASSLDAPQALAPSTSQYSRSPAAPIPTQLLAKLLLLKRTAEEDHDFLENEQFFLETLKKAPYNMASHSV
ncbi:fas-binding factor 1 isoform X2 [Nannospalax galili]|uniref:fas-binding factor 1 isoform X2 n=1 Tax=Nannospalax galili TaxID=1026970 RepID=UPI00111C059D|nr:fas-binding factor 1 isoform X2 [Nannospalax galili]